MRKAELKEENEQLRDEVTKLRLEIEKNQQNGRKATYWHERMFGIINDPEPEVEVRNGNLFVKEAQ